MSSFKTKTIALIASSLIVAVAGLSFATTEAFAGTASKKSTSAKITKEARIPLRADSPKKITIITVAPKAPSRKK